MHRGLEQAQPHSLLDDARLCRQVELNLRRNRQQDATEAIEAAVAAYRWDDCRLADWNPEPYALLWGTPLWQQSSASQRRLLNQLYWVAYYSQIMSAEIATIFLNQVSAAGLYAIEDFRPVCDSLDLETRQERVHIHAFKTIGEDVEHRLFGRRLFTYPMRHPFTETMVFGDSNRAKAWWKGLQLRAFSAMAGSAFLGSQYLLIRGLRTLNGKIVQHKLGQHYASHPDQAAAPAPAAISWYHFSDESFHFNTSRIVGLEVPRVLPKPTAFERWVVNRGVAGCQRDHYHFSTAINGIFWYDPALYETVYRLLRSPAFGLEHEAALAMVGRCFCEDSDGVQAAARTHAEAVESYKLFVEPIPWLNGANKEMRHMARNGVARYLATNRAAFARFRGRAEALRTQPVAMPAEQAA
ncbi:hypothetical protein [Chitinimonas koreensis]|uniref:hypothetical protein n=1 Tax=Chitinimonas koreensis TaxID=356302 RepID=UPI000429D7AD|nr:hypothetical protein [Chitinimonas koreensis]QNM94768.1 P-aminobenzoate N-oxygenase AurF [Chitinimonas koreensis]